jgi:hypothetical protein
MPLNSLQNIFRDLSTARQQNKHHQPRPGTRLRPFQHLSVASGVAEGGVWPLANEEVNPYGLAGTIVVEEHLWLTHEHCLAARVVVLGVWGVVERKPGLGRCMCHCFDPLSDSLWATSSTEQVMYEGF